MANEEHLDLLRQGVEVWNAWRAEKPSIRPDLSQAILLTSGQPQRGGPPRGEPQLGEPQGADLRGATSAGQPQRRTSERNWLKIQANLRWALLVETNLVDATLTDCSIYGISAWGVKLSERTKQQGLIITHIDEPKVTVDDLKVAQFVYLLLNNENIRDVIDTVGKKGVLLLGRFMEGRIAVLDRLREELRKRGYLPMVFNFDKPETKNVTESVRLLAGLSHFVIADVTNPRSAPLELQATVPDIMVPSGPSSRKERSPSQCLRVCFSTIGFSSQSTIPLSTRSSGRWMRRSSPRRRTSSLNS